MTNQPILTSHRAVSLPVLLSISIAAALGFHVIGIYAIWVTFGAWMTVALYTVGGLTILLQRVIAERRVATWSHGE
jgi:hypothetical protein